MWVVVKTMVRFWVPSILSTVLCHGPIKGPWFWQPPMCTMWRADAKQILAWSQVGSGLIIIRIIMQILHAWYVKNSGNYGSLAYIILGHAGFLPSAAARVSYSSIVAQRGPPQLQGFQGACTDEPGHPNKALWAPPRVPSRPLMAPDGSWWLLLVWVSSCCLGSTWEFPKIRGPNTDPK